MGWATRRSIRAPLALIVIATLALGTVKASGAVLSPKAQPSSQSESPGTLINDTQVSASGVDGTAYLVSYWSLTQQAVPVEVTGLIFVPYGSAPAGGWPVVSYGHPTDGMGPSCAPSHDPSSVVPNINELLKRGWEVVATDYQGETNRSIAPAPGALQPHGVSLPTAHDIVDIVLAATNLPAAHAGTKYVVWGFSQGASAATFVPEVATADAPGLTLEGIVSTAPPSDLLNDFYGAPTDSASPFTLMYVAGYNNAYGNSVAPLPLTPLGMTFYNDLSHECYDALASAMSPYRVDQVFTTTTPTFYFAILLATNDPWFLPQSADVPLLLPQGYADTTDTALDTWFLTAHTCAIGEDTVLWEYPGVGHDDIVDSSMGDVEHWIADRFVGGANPDSYSPDGVSGIQRTACN